LLCSWQVNYLTK